MKRKAEEADHDKKKLAMPNEVTAAPSSCTSTLTDLHNKCCYICKKSVPSILRTCSSCSCTFHPRCVAAEDGKLCNECLHKGLAHERASSNGCQTPVQDKQQTPESCITGLAVSYNMGWAKRGKGRNSYDDVGHMMGLHTGKVLSDQTRKKRCSTCSRAEYYDQDPSS